MKKLKLDADQVDKICEMANTLYEPTSCAAIYIHGEMMNVPKEPFTGYRQIHWLEYSIFNLAEKLFFNTSKRTNKEEYLNFIWEANLFWYGKAVSSKGAEHPVDALYNRFKQLK